MLANPAFDNAMSDDRIQELAPSVFSGNSHSKLSQKYRHIPTSEVLDGMRQAGFYPVKASQTKARDDERLMTNRHLLRFRHPDIRPNDEGEFPEVALYNSHNGSCSYRLMFGIFRLVCSNGLIVMSDSIGEVKVRHIGSPVDTVIEESMKLIKRAPEVFNTMTAWKEIDLAPDQQSAYAMLVRAARPGAIELDPMDILEARRPEDDVADDGSRSLWKTMNVAQENLIRGGFLYKDANNKSRTVREVTAVHADEIINRRLWEMTEGFARELIAA